MSRQITGVNQAPPVDGHVVQYKSQREIQYKFLKIYELNLNPQESKGLITI